jgi:hypothetical protein
MILLSPKKLNFNYQIASSKSNQYFIWGDALNLNIYFFFKTGYCKLSIKRDVISTQNRRFSIHPARQWGLINERFSRRLDCGGKT